MATLSVFVSSTFRDFHHERDLLNTVILESLNERVAPYGCRVELVDLRWGITAGAEDPDSRNATILDVCLGEIERSRPLFVGLVGQRYGWRLPLERLGHLATDPRLDGVADGVSITALEFEFGALRRPTEESIFFSRSVIGTTPQEWTGDDPASVQALHDRIAERCRVIEYTATAGPEGPDLTHFTASVLTHLGAILEQRAAHLAGTNTDAVRAATTLFFETKKAGLAGRGEVCRSLVGHLTRGAGVCLIGASGSGKSAVWCSVVEAVRDSGRHVVALPIAVVPEVSTLRGVLHRICVDLGAPAPEEFSAEQLEAHTIAALAGAGEVVLALDALDQLSDEPDLQVLSRLPAGVTLLASTTSSDHARLLAVNNIATVDLPPLTADSYAEAVRNLCALSGRSLPAPVVASLASRAPNPLWIRMAVDGLHSLDRADFADIDPQGDPLDEMALLLQRRVDDLPSSTDGLVTRVIDRASTRFGAGVINEVLALTAISRSGLRPLDIESLCEISSLETASIRRALSPLVAVRGLGGRVGFPHALIRRAVVANALDGRSETARHRQLADYLATAEVDPTCVEDRLWHGFRSPGVSLAAAIDALPLAQHDTVSRVVADSVDSDYFDSALTGLSPSGISFLTWTAHRHKRSQPTPLVISLALSIFSVARRHVDSGDLSEASTSALSNAAGCLADLPDMAEFDSASTAAEARRFTARVLPRAATTSASTAHALTTMWFARTANDPDQALSAYAEAVDLWEAIPDRAPAGIENSWLQFNLTQLAGLHHRAGRLNEAVSLYQRALPHAEALHGSRSVVGSSLGNLVNIHSGLAESYGASGQNSSARSHAIKAVEFARTQYKATPDRSSTTQFAEAGRQLALALVATGEDAQARDWMSYAERLFAEITLADPSNVNWEYGISTTALSCYLEIRAGNTQAAIELARRRAAAAPDPAHALDLICRLLHSNAKARRPQPLALELCESIIALLGDAAEPGSPHDLMLADTLSMRVHQLKAADRDAETRASLPLAIDQYRRLSPDAGSHAAGEVNYALAALYLLDATLSPPDAREAATLTLCRHLDEHLKECRGDIGTYKALSANLFNLGSKEPRFAPVLFRATEHFAMAFVADDPTRPERVLHLCGILDAIGVRYASAGDVRRGFPYWVSSAEKLGSFPDLSTMTPVINSVLRNLAIASKDAALSNDEQFMCSSFARRLAARQ